MAESNVKKILTDSNVEEHINPAIETALSEAKASGEFNGADGQDYVLTEADKEEIASLIDTESIPDYVITEAESVISRIMDAQGDRTFNMIVMSDLHNNGGVSDAQILHACQGAEYIANRVKVDAFICLGDHTDTFGKDDWAECLSDIFNCNNYKSRVKADRLEILGNHDYRTAKSPLTYKTISAYSEDVLWGDRLGGYFYKDYEDYKLRIIALNTSEASYIGVSSAQYNWLIDALDISTKEDATEWQILVLSHVPLDWSTDFSPFTNIFNAYINGTSWTDGTYSCDYTNKNQATLIATVHGHIHNLMISQMALGGSVDNGLIELYRIAIPEVTESYGNHYEAPFKHDITYSKTANTAKDTAFNVLCIDLDTKKINAICYGAGVDRLIDYTSLDTDNDSEEVSYTNQIPISIASDGTTYNNGQGWKTGVRLNSSGEEVEFEDWEVAGFIPITQNSIVRFANIDWDGDGQNKDYLAVYDSDFNPLASTQINEWFVNYASEYLTNGMAKLDDETGYVTYLNLSCLVTGKFGNTGADLSAMAYMRISAYEIDDNSVITVDEEINEQIAITWTKNIKIDKTTGEETSDDKHQYCHSQFIELNLENVYEITVSDWRYQGDDYYDISISCCYYDEGKNYLGYVEITEGQATETLTPISEAKWLKIRVWVGSGNDYQDEYLSQISLNHIY